MNDVGTAKDFMTREEVADLLQAKPKTISNWVSSKKIPFIRINGLLRFSRKALSSWVKSLAIESTKSMKFNNRK